MSPQNITTAVEAFTITLNDNASYKVPGGKRLVVETVSCIAEGTSNTTPIATGCISWLAKGAVGQHYFPVSFVATAVPSWWIGAATYPMKIYVEGAGAYFLPFFTKKTIDPTVPGGHAIFNFSGYFEKIS
jgi:hypothetical protein